MASDSRPPQIWTGQLFHFGCLAILLILTWLAWQQLAAPFPIAFWLTVAIPIAHQMFVWLSWRLQLSSSAITKSIGYRAYLVIFFVLLISRVITIAILAWLDRGSLGLPRLAWSIITITLSLIAIYTGYSVARYFGFERAAGADHFKSAYREMPMVKQGIFRFTNNGMYTGGFMLLWAIALGFDSSAALVAAAFSHAYIWVHFFATEQPDMRYLYHGT